MSDTQWKGFVANSGKFIGYSAPDYFNKAVYISLANKYVYFENLKVATNSILRSLTQFELGQFCESIDRDTGYFHDREYIPLLKPSQVLDFPQLLTSKEFTKFTFVRNPYTRLASAYLNKIARDIVTPQKSRLLMQLGDGAECANRDISFAECVALIEKQPISYMDPHFRPQFYTTCCNSLELDLIGRFEDMQKGFDELNDLLASTQTLKLLNQAPHQTNAHQQLSSLYDRDLTERVYKIYQKDFEYFGYSKNIEEAIL